jgi:oxygen-dependent protoporphyrinogen oxidase
VSTVIIGGGITGLSAAWELTCAGHAVTLIEPGSFGGLLRSERVDDCTIECGADSWIRTKPALRELARELGLAASVIPADESRRGTFLVREGKLAPLPRGLRLITPTQVRPILQSPLFSWRTKLKMAMEIFRSPRELPDRSVAEFVRDHFGPEAIEYLAEPLFAGVYGGSPETLGAAGVLPRMFGYESRYGSLIRGARTESEVRGPLFESMLGGLGQIPQALVAQLDGRVNIIRTHARAVEPGRVRVSHDWIPTDQVILACGAASSAKLLCGESSALLGRISHSSATIFAFGFHRSDLAAPPEGFGFLVPRKERRVIMGATWVSNKFPQRAPADQVVLRCFVSGDHSESLAAEVLEDLARITGVRAKPWFTRCYRWPESMPQYAVNHARLIEQIRSSLPPGVLVTGNFLQGVGMPDCVASGRAAARLILKPSSP